MQIELKLSKDFERCLEDLKEKYGEDWKAKAIADIQELTNRELDYNKRIAQDKLQNLAKALFEENKGSDLDFLLSDISDKSIRQINEAMRKLDDMASVS